MTAVPTNLSPTMSRPRAADPSSPEFEFGTKPSLRRMRIHDPAAVKDALSDYALAPAID